MPSVPANRLITTVTRVAPLWLALVMGGPAAPAQDTFSFVLHDARSGAFVSAGGSCIDGDAIAGAASVISYVVPDRGVVHTQSYYHPDNQALGARLLSVGLSAKPLLDSLTTADVSLTPGFRQYVVATADGASAVYTGEDCAPWAGHLRGDGFAMAGNILLDSTVLRRMRAALLSARSKNENLLAQAVSTLEAAAFPGADRRCLAAGISCRSAFLKIALPTDAPHDLTIDERVSFPEGEEDPIRTLARRLANSGADEALRRAMAAAAPPSQP